MGKKHASTRAKRLARRCALQALYQWHMTGTSIIAIEKELLQEKLQQTPNSKLDVDYFRELLQQVTHKAEELDACLAPMLDRPIRRLNAIEHAILRIGVYELLYHPELPYRVIISEGLLMAKTFGTVQGFAYVNAVLDACARALRPDETKQA